MEFSVVFQTCPPIPPAPKSKESVDYFNYPTPPPQPPTPPISIVPHIETPLQSHKQIQEKKPHPTFSRQLEQKLTSTLIFFNSISKRISAY